LEERLDVVQNVSGEVGGRHSERIDSARQDLQVETYRTSGDVCVTCQGTVNIYRVVTSDWLTSSSCTYFWNVRAWEKCVWSSKSAAPIINFAPT